MHKGFKKQAHTLLASSRLPSLCVNLLFPCPAPQHAHASTVTFCLWNVALTQLCACRRHLQIQWPTAMALPLSISDG